MKAAKRRRLEAAGWKLGSAQDFLQEDAPEQPAQPTAELFNRG